jgi:hypothetical protein
VGTVAADEATVMDAAIRCVSATLVRRPAMKEQIMGAEWRSGEHAAGRRKRRHRLLTGGSTVRNKTGGEVVHRPRPRR